MQRSAAGLVHSAQRVRALALLVVLSFGGAALATVPAVAARTDTTERPQPRSALRP
jgi:hypothetical protein